MDSFKFNICKKTLLYEDEKGESTELYKGARNAQERTRTHGPKHTQRFKTEVQKHQESSCGAAATLARSLDGKHDRLTTGARGEPLRRQRQEGPLAKLPRQHILWAPGKTFCHQAASLLPFPCLLACSLWQTTHGDLKGSAP